MMDSAPVSAPTASTPSTPSAPATTTASDSSSSSSIPSNPTDAPDSFGGQAESTEQAPEAPKPIMHKVKIGGVESEVTQEQLIAQYQKGVAAEKRFQEAAKIQKQTEQFIEALTADPVKVLSNPNLGINFREIAENYLYEQLQQEMMTPEQRQQREAMTELERYRAQEQQRIAQQREAKANQLRDRYANEYTEKFTGALQETGLPKTQWTVSRMANYMQQALQANIDPDVKDIAALVKEDYLQEQRELFSSLDGDSLIETLGEDLAKKFRMAEVAKLKRSSQNSQSTPVQAPQTQKKETRLDRADWIRQIKAQNGL